MHCAELSSQNGLTKMPRHQGLLDTLYRMLGWPNALKHWAHQGRN